MPTRRDQSQAHRFQHRQTLSALVAGEPNAFEAPMRGLSAATVGGVLIAVLVAAAFAVFGLRDPGGRDWRTSRTVIVDRTSGAHYVYLNHLLHPVVNDTSAVLAAGGGQAVTRVSVGPGELAGARYGREIGIAGAPSTLPTASDLVDRPTTVCSRARATGAGDIRTTVTLRVDAGATARPVDAAHGIVVSAASDPDRAYLLYRGRRLAIGSRVVARLLGLPNTAIPVSSAFLDAVPAGPSFTAPAIAGAGREADYRLAGRRPVIGRLVRVVDAGSHDFVVLADGLAPVTAVQAAVLGDLAISARGGPLAPLPVTSVQVSQPKSSRSWQSASADLQQLPASLPSPVAATRGADVCAVYRGARAATTFAVAAHSLPQDADGAVGDSSASAVGHADLVQIPVTHAVLAAPTGRPSTLFVIAGQEKYPVPRADVLDAFGYQHSRPTRIPARILDLIPSGPALDPAAARRPVAP